MKVLLVIIVLLLVPPTGAFAKKSKPTAIKRYTCPTSYMENNGAIPDDRRVKYDPEFLHFSVQGKDVADMVNFLASYDIHESDLPKDSALNPGGKCDFGKDRKGKAKKKMPSEKAVHLTQSISRPSNMSAPSRAR